MRKLFDPASWTPSFYLGTALVLLVLNFFGPRGLVGWILSYQDLERLEEKESKLSADILEVQKDIDLFKSSSAVRERALREELGYLQANELSVEFVQGSDSTQVLK